MARLPEEKDSSSQQTSQNDELPGNVQHAPLQQKRSPAAGGLVGELGAQKQQAAVGFREKGNGASGQEPFLKLSEQGVRPGQQPLSFFPQKRLVGLHDGQIGLSLDQQSGPVEDPREGSGARRREGVQNQQVIHSLQGDQGIGELGRQENSPVDASAVHGQEEIKGQDDNGGSQESGVEEVEYFSLQTSSSQDVGHHISLPEYSGRSFSAIVETPLWKVHLKVNESNPRLARLSVGNFLDIVFGKGPSERSRQPGPPKALETFRHHFRESG